MRLAISYLRFSTGEQAKGDSQRRQWSTARAYAAENKLEIIDTLKDLGVSAFRGKNRIKGALGQLLSLAESGELQRRGITDLIVEALDRLSRDEIDEAYDQFRRLVCRERSIVRGDGGRFTTPPPSRLEARSRLGDKAANELG